MEPRVGRGLDLLRPKSTSIGVVAKAVSVSQRMSFHVKRNARDVDVTPTLYAYTC